MNLTSQEIINLKVETKSGQKLGRVADFIIDANTYTITTYHIKSKNIIEGLFKNELIINQSQVITIDKEKMVVEDNVITEQDLAKASLTPEQAV